MSEIRLPTYRDLLWPTLQSLAEELGGSGGRYEVIDAVIDRVGITDEQLEVVYPPDATARGPKVHHRIAFALSSLKGAAAVDNPSRGVWAINSVGRELMSLGEEAVRGADKSYRDALAARRRLRQADGEETSAPPPPEADEPADETPDAEDAWKHELVEVLVETLLPTDFESLVLRLMREEGCTNIRSTAVTGDGGIDGLGELRSGLLTFPVCFQMKLYRPGNNVGSKDIRDLRGAVAGRGGRGIFVTTSDYTKDAITEASRNQDAPLELIDGLRLAELLYKHGIGVQDQPTVDRGFFTEFSTKPLDAGPPSE